MDKKKSNRISKSVANTRDIRSFFDYSNTKSNGVNSTSSSGESPVKKPKKETSSKIEDKMPPKRKKIATYLESSGSEDEMVVKKKSKKEKTTKKSRKNDDEDSVPEIKSKRQKKASSDDEDFVPKKLSKKNATSDDEDFDDDFDDELIVSKPLKKTASKSAASKTSKTTKSNSKAKAGTKSKTKKTTTGKAKGKLVKPMDYESSDNEEHVESTMIDKKDEPVMSGFEFRTSKQKIPGDSKKGMLWVDRYRPKKVIDIIGQQTPKSNANKLKNWLMNWEENKDIKPKFGQKNETGAGLRSALLSGIPGIGKTTTAQLVAKECGWDFVEFNASDICIKKSMDSHIKALINNKSLSGFFQDEKHETELNQKHLVIMDEVDGMSGNSDRGGISELIQLIKKTQIPIICICNDRNSMKIRSLANYCFDLRFSKIRTPQIMKLANEICAKEGIKVDQRMLEETVEMSNRDVRQVIHYLSVFAIRTKTISASNFNKIIKNVTVGPFDCMHHLFTKDEYNAMSFYERMNIFFSDYSMIPLMVYENYLISRPTNSETAADTLEAAVKSIDAMCIGDLISTEIRTKQTWNLLPLQGVFSTVMPGHYMELVLELIRLFPKECIPVAVQILGLVHLTFQEQYMNFLPGPYFPRVGQNPNLSKSSLRPTRPVFQMHFHPKMLQIPFGKDKAYDNNLKDYYTPYYNFIANICRLAIGNNIVNQELVGFCSMVALESLVMRVTVFPALWNDLKNTSAGENFIDMLCNSCNYFKEYITLILISERDFLQNDVVFELVKHVVPKFNSPILTPQFISKIISVDCSVNFSLDDGHFIKKYFELFVHLKSLLAVFSNEAIPKLLTDEHKAALILLRNKWKNFSFDSNSSSSDIEMPQKRRKPNEGSKTTDDSEDTSLDRPAIKVDSLNSDLNKTKNDLKIVIQNAIIDLIKLLEFDA